MNGKKKGWNEKENGCIVFAKPMNWDSKLCFVSVLILLIRMAKWWRLGDPYERIYKQNVQKVGTCLECIFFTRIAVNLDC